MADISYSFADFQRAWKYNPNTGEFDYIPIEKQNFSSTANQNSIFGQVDNSATIVPLPSTSTGSNTGTGTDSSWFSGLTGENGIFSKNNLQTLGAVLGTIESFYNMYNSNRAYGLAKDQFNFQKQFATKNLANQIASYNTALTDRMQARAAMETGNKNAYDDQIAQRKLV